MAKTTFFVQPCPTCGRNLEIRVQYLGRNVVCQHCRAEFLARQTGSVGVGEPVTTDAAAPESASPLLARAEQLLALFDGAAARRPTAPV